MESLQLSPQKNSKMNDDGLDSFRSIRRSINDQDEKIWRQTATKKYLKKEIETLHEQTKFYENQIETLKSGSPYRSTKNVTQLMTDAMDQQMQIHKVLMVSLNSKKFEIEHRKADILSWDEKYNAVIVDLKEVYEKKRAFHEIHNPAYEQLRKSKIAQKLARIEVNQWKATVAAKKRMFTELSEIKRKILHRSVVNFVKAISRQKQDAELNVKLDKAISRRRQLGQMMLEAQEALKKQNSINAHGKKEIFNFNRVQKIDFSRIDNDIIENTKEIRCSTSVTAEDTNKVTDVQSDKKIIQIKNDTIKRNNVSNKIKVIENKKIALPPLKSILSESRSRFNCDNRSFCDTSFNKSQSIEQSSQNDRITQKKAILSQESNFGEKSQLQSKPNISEGMLNTQKIRGGIKNRMTNSTGFSNTAPNISSEYLKNLKLTTKLPQNIINQTPMKFTFDNRFPVENQNQHKASILKVQNLKRNISSQNEDAAYPLAKKDRNVNFAMPIEEHCDNMESTAIQGVNNSLGSNSLDMSMHIDEGSMIVADSVQDMTNQQFSFNYDNTETAGDNNLEPLPANSPPMFQDIMNSGQSFGFSFRGGMLETANEMWDLFK